MTNQTDIWGDLFATEQRDLDNATTTSKRDVVKYPCEHCGGTGRWRRGSNRYGETKCFGCGGKGYFKSSKQDRQKAKRQRQESKARKLQDALGGFEEAYPGIRAALDAIKSWNSFALSLASQLEERGSLSEKQVQAAQRMLAKLEANKKKRDDAATAVDLSAIRDMFETAYSKGHKRPKYRAEGLVISRAPDSGRNAGSLYVKLDDDDEFAECEYQGKLTPDNMFRPVGSVDARTLEALNAIAANPAEAAVRYGRRTGQCSICARQLTNSESIDRGIGPICADKFGF